MEKEVYEIMDSFLLLLKKGEASIYSMEKIHTTPQKIAQGLLEEHKLITIRNKETKGTLADITLLGEKVISNGGCQKWIEDKETDRKNKENLERIKLKYDVQNVKRIYKTYWFTFTFSVLALIISAMLLFLKFTE